MHVSRYRIEIEGRAHLASAHARPSAPPPASIRFATLQPDVRIAATLWLASQDTYANWPSGRITTSWGAAGTAIVWATFMACRSTTPTLLTLGMATTSQRPSGVGAVP